MVAQNLFFYGIAAVIVYSGFRVVTSDNVVHAALHLVAVLASVAAQYVLLAAEFVAATQVLVYIGAIVVLFLFGIMLTRAKLGRDQDLTNQSWPLAALTAVVLFGVMAYALIDEYHWNDTPLPDDPRIVAVDGSNTATVSDSIFSTYLVPFEVVSVLLLAALVGAIVLAREGVGMDDLLLNQFLLLGAVLFCLGVYGVLARKNAVLVLMSIELILNAVNINLIAFGAMNNSVAGAVFALFVIAIAAAEVGVGLAIVLLIYRNRRSVDLDDVAQMKG